MDFTAGGSPRGRVLLVDDELSVLSVLAAILEEECEVRVATEAALALRFLSEGTYDVVISDHNMPGGLGTELLDTVASRYPATSRILLTGDPHSPEVRAQVRKSATTSHTLVLFKPIDPKVLVTWVQHAIASARLKCLLAPGSSQRDAR